MSPENSLPIKSVRALHALPVWLVDLLSEQLGRYRGAANDRLSLLLSLLPDAGALRARIHADMLVRLTIIHRYFLLTAIRML